MPKEIVSEITVINSQKRPINMSYEVFQIWAHVEDGVQLWNTP